MDIRLVSRTVDPFRAPKRTLGDLDADAAARLVTVASDIALVIDSKGVVRDVAFGSEDLAREGFADWVGLNWIDTVSPDSRQKIEELIAEAEANVMTRWRQVNHPAKRGPDVPVRYAAVKVANGRVVVVGRDLRNLAVLQQRLVDAQQTTEREYARLRHAETRYRLLFQIASEAVIIIDAVTQKITDANPAAGQLLIKGNKKLAGRSFADLFDAAGQKKINAYLTAIRTSGKSDEVRVRLAETKAEVVVSATMFRQEHTSNLLIRLSPANPATSTWLRSQSRLFDVVEKLPDGFVVTDIDRRVLTANTAFIEMTQMATAEQIQGEPIDRWLGRQSVDTDVLMKNLSERGEIRNFSTVIRGEYGTTADVEVSAVAVTGTEQPCFGLTIRNVGRRPDAAINAQRTMPRSVEQMTELVGRVALKDLVRESTDMIERLCIEAALELTRDNRASAAELLGLSRQGFYSKLRRHGLGDLDGQSGEEE
jgi:transcriptional regulator PpsR